MAARDLQEDEEQRHKLGKAGGTKAGKDGNKADRGKEVHMDGEPNSPGTAVAQAESPSDDTQVDDEEE